MAAIRKGDVQDLISDVRDMLERRNDPTEAELKRLAQKYVALVQQVNSMLKTCLDLVEKGLKVDAIMRADQENLLEIVSILDFPEQDVWVDYLNQFGLQAPPAVDQFASRQINACYAPAQLLEPLYRLNRRHALANSPLNVRLGVMRRIHKTEVGSAKEVFGRHVELFETERIKGVRKELADAQQARDHRKLQMLCAELSSKDWIKRPDTETVRSAIRAFKQEEARRARLHMKKLAALLQDKWSAHDVAGGRQLREIWNTCQQKALLPDDNPLILETRAAFAWLQEIDEEELKEERYQELVAQLRDALDQRYSKELLQRVENALKAFDQGVPESLSSQLQTRYDEIDTETTRKNTRRLVIAALSVIGIVGLAGFILRDRNVANQIDGHCSAMITFLERGDVESAKLYAEAMQQEQPEMSLVPQIKTLLLDIDQAVRDEDARRTVFESGVGNIAERLDLATTLADTKSLREQLDSLPSRTDAEIVVVEKLTESVAHRQTQIHEQIDNAFTLAFERAAAELKEYEQSGQRDIKRFEEFRTVFIELSKSLDVSAELISRATGPMALIARCESQMSEMNLQVRRDQMLRRITAGVGSLTEFRAAMDAYVKEFPKDDRLALRFDNLLRTEADFWPQVEVQNQFVTQHSSNCTRISPAEAGKYLSESEAFLVTHPQFPRRMALEKICAYLRFVSNRIDADGQPIHASIMDQLDKANLKDLYTVQLRSGERHYTDKEPHYNKEGGTVQISRLTDWQAAQRQRETRTRSIPAETVEFLIRVGEPGWEAPESVLIREIQRDLNGIDEHDWERVMVELLERVYTETRQDPIFRLFMLRTILESAVAGSQVVSQHYAKILVDLKNEPLNNINPFDPDDAATNLKRKHATELLKPFENPANLLPKIVSQRESLSKLTIGGRYRWFAWLNRDPTGWVCLSDKLLSTDVDGDLFIFVKGSATAPQFHAIGTVRKGISTVTDTTARLTEGQPVYVYEE